MDPLIDETVAIVYGKHNAYTELYTWISENICENCIKNDRTHCQTCEVILIKERITELLCE